MASVGSWETSLLVPPEDYAPESDTIKVDCSGDHEVCSGADTNLDVDSHGDSSGGGSSSSSTHCSNSGSNNSTSISCSAAAAVPATLPEETPKSSRDCSFSVDFSSVFKWSSHLSDEASKSRKPKTQAAAWLLSTVVGGATALLLL
mmetsp:Transcript_12101/g.18318  ORF Transcript_12101/g.18318 Transcript_12101/m.18318 type:complete len:146 (+) Transcript_12101:61-498(+)